MAKGSWKRIECLFFKCRSMRKKNLFKKLTLQSVGQILINPGKYFEQEAIEELKQSIVEHGILQPLIVRKTIKGYEIVVGERRFRAAKEAKLDKVPAVDSRIDRTANDGIGRIGKLAT